MTYSSPSRRHFFFGSLLAGAVPTGGFGSTASLRMMGYKSPNEKMNLAAIGSGGKGASDIAGCASENIVALCDVDDKRAARTFNLYEKAPKFKDFRQMLDKEGKNIDAVIVATPDHMHATATMWCMERGKHVYTQKPLTHTVWEARELTKAAAKYKVATQMGNQGYSNDGTRQCAEMIWAGEIGEVKEVHAWSNRPIWPQGLTEMPKTEPVPSNMDWQQWLGPAPDRPYSSAYAPFAWRGFFEFGCGALGDMACHILGAPNMALMLGSPASVECVSQESKSEFMFPKKSVIRFDFPARANMPAVKIFWYDGCIDPPFRPEGLGKDEILGDLPRARPAAAPKPRPQPPPAADSSSALDQMVNRLANVGSNGSLFVGDKGLITTGTYGEGTRLLPASKMADYKFPAPLLTRSPGHYRDWIRACKGGEQSCSNFSIAGPFTEWILLGSLSLRFEGKLEWDSEKMRITNNREANELLRPKFRKGWQFT
ncbi:MAG: Gfo/Idh/MocA family oxidoreductase [Acidobacteriota bacterium]